MLRHDYTSSDSDIFALNLLEQKHSKVLEHSFHFTYLVLNDFRLFRNQKQNEWVQFSLRKLV